MHRGRSFDAVNFLNALYLNQYYEFEGTNFHFRERRTIKLAISGELDKSRCEI